MNKDAPALTKIVATLGPATDSPETVCKLALAGVSVFRLNFSHGEPDEHKIRLAIVRDAENTLGRPLAILGDLGGPKIRVGHVPQGGLTLVAGQDVVIDPSAREARVGDPPVLPCGYGRISHEASPGHRVLINDGAIRMLVVESAFGASEAADKTLRCRVIMGGLVTTGKGINLPDSQISAPALTEKDREFVRWSVEHGVDFLALSFVRTAAEIRELRELLEGASRGVGPASDPRGLCAMGGPIPIIAKIEKPQAVDNIDEILDEADGIMVARGDLGVELDVAQVPIIQKRLIARAQEFGKPCIVATQMLESMIEKSAPTRAEASDVANAILDGAGAVMLSGETAVGAHPVLVVETMRRIMLYTESQLGQGPRLSDPPTKPREARDYAAALAHGAWHVVGDVDAAFVAVWSQSGGTARMLSQNAFNVPIYAFSSDRRAVRRMAILRGVTPVLWTDIPSHRSDFAAMVDQYTVGNGLVERGRPCVLLAGKPFGVTGVVNTIAVRSSGEFVREPYTPKGEPA
ncbi:MAG: pyruvate kinase [Phycisphaerales bacterium]|nr:MAG: pyruvate kinase [Phycisphaerales bacterium]